MMEPILEEWKHVVFACFFFSIFSASFCIMNKRLLYVCCMLVTAVAVFSRCFHGEAKEKPDLRGEQFAGAETCISCHKDIYKAFMTTGHYATSRPATDSTVLGSFAAPGNVFYYNDSVKVVMEKRDSGLFQVAYHKDQQQQIHRFDIAFGSGRKAQTYLYWQDNKYFQLPVSYLVPAHSWANSPGFPATQARFDRPVPSICFGCHSSMVGISDTKMVGLSISEEFEKNKVVYGIDCERCHGPAAKHVDFHVEHPLEKKAMFITTISSLNNQQKLDMCALCHSGIRPAQKSPFTFQPGNRLSDYIFMDIGPAPKATTLDVHGTQYQLFTSSKCYLKSNGTMNCSTCHNPHVNERNDMQAFSQKCMSCHNTDSHTFCTMKEVAPALLKKNCVDCHMPALPSGNITLLVNGNDSPVPDYIRTHLITTYQEETRKVVEMLKQQQKHL